MFYCMGHAQVQLYTKSILCVFSFQVTSLIHMKGKQVYDPLIGQFVTPNWEHILDMVETPERLHLYRTNGNDPVNFQEPNLTFGTLSKE